MSLEGRIKKFRELVERQQATEDWDDRKQMADTISKLEAELVVDIHEKITHWQLLRVYGQLAPYNEVYIGLAQVTDRDPHSVVLQYDRLMEMNHQLESGKLHFVHSEEFGTDDDGGPSYHSWFMESSLYNEYEAEYMEIEYSKDEVYMPQEYLLLPKYLNQYHNDDRLVYCYVCP